MRTALAADALELGESITVNGACMTVVEFDDASFAFDVSAESLRRTALGELAAGAVVNLERSLRMSDRLGGHVVSGHVDGVGRVAAIRPEGESRLFSFSMPPELAAGIVEKGSIAVDGISLTCFACRDDGFDVAVIPHTLDVTTLGRRAVGDGVNLETDVLGKYVARLLEAHRR